MGTPLHVLFVEDCEDDVVLIVRELRRGGYDPIYQCVDAAEPLRAALARQAWDLVIADYILPHFDGRAALALVRESGQDLPFLIVSGAIGEETAVAAMKAGAHDYLMKDRLSRLPAVVARELIEAEGRRARRRIEEELRHSELRFTTAFDHAPIGMALTATDGRYLRVNHALCQMVGYSEEELLATTYMAITHPEDRSANRAAVQQMLAGELQTYQTEKRYLHKDSHLVWVLLNVTLVTNVQDRSCQFFAQIQDITERKRAEQALQVQARVLESMTEAVNLANEEGIMLLTNPAHDTMFGYERGELLGQPVTVLNACPPPENSWMVRGIIEQLKTRGTWFGEFTNRKKDGTVFLTTARITALEIEGKKHWVSVQEDITERKRAEEERQAALLRSRLFEHVMAAREEEQRRIARDLHDGIGQSLTSLRMGLRAVEDAPTLEAARSRTHELRGFAAAALEEVRRLARGLRPSVLDDLGLGPALERVAGDCAQAHGLAVIVDAADLIPARLPRVVETALFRIAQEALTNVVKHAEATAVRIAIERQAAAVRMTVEDDGRGFDRTPHHPPGTVGLGLSGMRERAALLHGAVAIQPRAEGGTTIRVDIPLEEENYDVDSYLHRR
jgi:PAS domain S-box-containing protein